MSIRYVYALYNVNNRAGELEFLSSNQSHWTDSIPIIKKEYAWALANCELGSEFEQDKNDIRILSISVMDVTSVLNLD